MIIMRKTTVIMLVLAAIFALTACESVKIRTIVPTTFSYENASQQEDIAETSSRNESDYAPKKPSNYNCFDTDYARDLNVKGTCYDMELHEAGTSDYCTDSHVLVELYCSNDAEKGCLTETVYCNTTCSAGACTKAPSQNPLQ